MARPIKNNADYFPHDIGLRKDSYILALRNRYSHMGYAVWCFLMEVLTASENFRLILNELSYEIYAADFGVTVDQLHEIIDYCVKIELLQRGDDGSIGCNLLDDSLSFLIEKRKRDRNRLSAMKTTKKEYIHSENSSKNTVIAAKTHENDSNRDIIAAKIPQVKVKDKDKVYTSGGTNVPLSSDEPMTGDGIDFLAFQEFFNRTMQEHSAQIPTVTQIGQKRRAAVNARMKEHGKDALRTAIVNAATSAFLNGAGEQCFVASFDWIFRPTNFLKVLEGNYNHELTPKNSNNYGKGQQKTARERIEEELAEGEEYFNGMLVRNEASLHSNVPAKVWEH